MNVLYFRKIGFIRKLFIKLLCIIGLLLANEMKEIDIGRLLAEEKLFVN